MAAILHVTLSAAFYQMEIWLFWLEINWNTVCLSVYLIDDKPGLCFSFVIGV